jgi:hypothetical protein
LYSIVYIPIPISRLKHGAAVPIMLSELDVFPKVPGLETSSQCNSVDRWGLEEGMKSRELCAHEWINAGIVEERS